MQIIKICFGCQMEENGMKNIFQPGCFSNGSSIIYPDRDGEFYGAVAENTVVIEDIPCTGEGVITAISAIRKEAQNRELKRMLIYVDTKDKNGAMTADLLTAEGAVARWADGRFVEYELAV